MTRLVRTLVLLLSLGLSAACFGAYYQLHFKWRGCFNELGRCIDPETGVVYSESSGLVWLPLALLSCGLSIALIWREVK